MLRFFTCTHTRKPHAYTPQKHTCKYAHTLAYIRTNIHNNHARTQKMHRHAHMQRGRAGVVVNHTSNTRPASPQSEVVRKGAIRVTRSWSAMTAVGSQSTRPYSISWPSRHNHSARGNWQCDDNDNEMQRQCQGRTLPSLSTSHSTARQRHQPSTPQCTTRRTPGNSA